MVNAHFINIFDLSGNNSDKTLNAIFYKDLYGLATDAA